MKIVNIIGGLGNQMFQYALAIALQQTFPDEKILIDPKGFKGYKLHNGYELSRVFGVHLPEAGLSDQMKLYYPIFNYCIWQIAYKLLPRRRNVVYDTNDINFRPEILSDKGSAYYVGYWQSEKYFKNFRQFVIKAFTFPKIPANDRNFKLLEEIKKHRTVSIHVRRGDYLNNESVEGICSLKYYAESIRFIKEKKSPDLFLIFSDDSEWCKENLREHFNNDKVIYVDWNKSGDSYRDMQLMSLCDHNIIANSSFSWWGAWLNQNPDKLVISPAKWMNDDSFKDITPDEWLKVKG